MKLPSNWENIAWGVGLIVVSIGTYVIAMVDGDSTTHADINVLLIGITAGLSKFRSAGTTETAELKAEVKEVKSDVKEVTRTVEESVNPSIKSPFNN